MKLVLGTQSINVNENLKLYNDLKNMFIDKGIIIAEKYLEEYSKYGNIDTALNKFDDFLQENYKELSECVCEILFKNGIYNVTAESFFSKYYDKYFNIYEQVSPIMDKLDEIADYANALDSQLESRKMSRGKWVGGGFGMSGAIKGAVGASALNAVGGAFHGIGDFFRGMSNDSKIGKLKKELYNDPHTNYLLSLSIYKGCSNFFFGLRDELINHKLLSPIKFNSSEATAMSKNAMKYCKNKEELQELLIKSVCMAPYAISLYKPLYSKFKDTKGLNEFAAFFGVDKELQFRNNLSIKKQLMIISEMPERDIEEQCEKLIEYIKLANEKNYDITDEMAKIVTLILKESASSASKLNNAIEIIKKKVPSNYKDDISRVISVFEKEKKDIIKNTEQKRVEELPSSNKEEIIAKIVKTMEVGNKYGIDESQSITSLLKKISQKYNSFSDLSDIENELEDLKCSKYPQIEIAIQSCEIRKKLRNFEIICDSIKPYMFSPQIIDMIKEARNGNPLHQQCLVEMFCKYDFLNSLRVSIKKGDENEKKESQKTVDLCFEVISYLFDMPETYSFDLFMRLKFNYIYIDSIYEYIETIKAFSDNENCPAGIFEYGRLLCKYVDKKDGMKVLQKAAKIGYNQAISYMYDICKKNNCTTKDAQIYEFLLDDKSPFQKIFSVTYDEDMKDQIILNYYYISHLINAKYSYIINGSATLSTFIKDIWDCFLVKNDSDSSLGYITEEREPKHNLKTAKLYLWVSRNEDALLSYSTKDIYGNMGTFVLTDKQVYWNEKKSKYSLSYNKMPSLYSDKEFEFSNMPTLKQILMIITNSYKEYSPLLSINDLEKMAYCGHPLAICNLLSNKDYEISDDKRAHWLKVRDSWISKGKFFVVCPECHAERQIGDMFCPDCGTKIY